MRGNELIDAWIDVGGTFTDCFVRLADGSLRSGKTLSSGRVPVSISDVQARSAFAQETGGDPTGFWTGCDLVVMNSRGEQVERIPIGGSENGRINLLGDQAPELLQTISAKGLRAEIDPGVEAPVVGVRRLLGVPLSQSLPRLRVRLGTTKGTNALLTRTGAVTAFAVTSPFEDLLAIGDQTRENLFDLNPRKPLPLASRSVGIVERLSHDGSVLLPLDESLARTRLVEAREAGCDSLAICLMHSHVNASHEQQLKRIAEELGFEHIGCSSEVAPLIEIVAKSQTTVVDAYLSPIIRAYLRKLVSQFSADASPVDLQVMTSAGGLVDWQEYSGKDSILSGPAGGVAALRAIGEAAGMEELIGLDMGGTSTDVCRVAANSSLQYESMKAGVRILTPTLPIETVAAGGGSVCWFDGVSLRVGPASAGAQPGPACYGRGGPLTLTDLNVFLGLLPVEQFPFPLDKSAVNMRLEELRADVASKLGPMTHSELARGLRRIAIEQMADAVRTVSLAQGVDPRNHVLASFGGAAGQHICDIADALGLTRIVDTEQSGLLSALGMGLADQRADGVLPVYQVLEEANRSEFDAAIETLKAELGETLVRQGAARGKLESRVGLELRYEGTDATLLIPTEGSEGPRARFHAAHAHRFGYQREETAVELVAVRVEVTAGSNFSLPRADSVAQGRRYEFANARLNIARSELNPGDSLVGPANVLNPGATLCVEKGWVAKTLSDGTLIVSRSEQAEHSADIEKAEHVGHAPMIAPGNPLGFDPVFRDCYAARLVAIATQMGTVLQQTAVSVNVKQRRDFSCAVFSGDGQLLANAPHVPVHLGAMGQAVRAIIEQFPLAQPGDRFGMNDPYCGGSHLPDITVITPVFDGSRLVMWVANRAHHADVGGISPGSMSTTATRLGEEGVIIPPMQLTALDLDCTADLRNLLESATYPPRNIPENLADIRAQMAANELGVQLLTEYARAESWSQLGNYAEHLLSAAEERVRQFVSTLVTDGSKFQGAFQDYLDDGTPIAVAVTADLDGSLQVDFTGTGPVSPANFNANPSIVNAAVLYVLRCLIADDLPLNEGALRSVLIHVPEGILNPPPNSDPTRSPAVAAGNVETSQRVVDVLLGAFGAAAASQGTMNNLLFGNERFGFYETICGGAGATPNSDGCSGIHTHMTNTRLTDPEVLEARYPVRLVSFHLRRGSGGRGRRCGGDGVVRELEFLEPVHVSLLTSRRTSYPPFGLCGGQPGSLGENLLRSGGHVQSLPNCVQLHALPGDRLTIITPGGGGFGRAIGPAQAQALAQTGDTGLELGSQGG